MMARRSHNKSPVCEFMANDANATGKLEKILI